MVQHESTEELLKRCATVLEKVRRVSRKLTNNVHKTLANGEESAANCPHHVSGRFAASRDRYRR